MTAPFVDVTALVDWLGVMIRIADKMAETTPYPAAVKKLRDAAKRELDAATEAMS